MRKAMLNAQRADPVLRDWLRILQAVYRPASVLLVGAGDGSGDLARFVQEMECGKKVFIEAEDDQYQALRQLLATKEGRFQTRQAVVAETASQFSFFKSSLIDESGILAPEDLIPLWANLKTTARREVQGTPLKQLLALFPSDWLIIDCMPSGEMLRGATALLDRVNVVLARVVIPSSVVSIPDELLSRCGQEAVDSSLSGLGFHHAITQPSDHPRVGHALYVRSQAAQTVVPGETEGSSGVDAKATVVPEQPQGASRKVGAVDSSMAETMAQLEAIAKKHGDEIEKLKRRIADIGDSIARQINQQAIAKEQITRASSQVDLLKQIFMQENLR
ncbi:hypothetical protein ACLQ9J_18880 [Bordetella hinzii]